MISDKQLLTLLIGAAIGAGGWLYRFETAGGAGSEALENQLRIAQEEITMLAEENASLRSLAQGGGEFSVPQEMISMVEKDYGLKFISSPVIHRVATEELGYRIEAAIESRLGPQGVDDRQEAYQRIGWLRGGDALLEQLVAVRSVGAVVWFDEQLGEGWVTDRFNLKNIPDQAAMTRLLVRILLNQHFPAPVAYQGDDAARAREALHAGAASAAEARFFANSARSIGFMPMTNNSAAERLMLTLPPFIQGVTLFPVVSGRALADTLFVKGVDTFTSAFRNPPQNTYQLVFPADEKKTVNFDMPEIDSELFLTESAGYLGMRLWLEEMGDVALAEEIARDWLGDAYHLFADGETSSALIWELEFQNTAMAARFEELAKQRVEAMKGLHQGRLLGVEKISSTRIRFINAATDKTRNQFVSP
jgi:hypothetical protein